MRRRDEVPERSRLGKDRRELRARRCERLDVVVIEETWLLRLHDEDALQQSSIDNRDAEKRAIRIFAGFAENT